MEVEWRAGSACCIIVIMPQVDLLSIEKMAAGEFSILDYCDAFLITFQKIHPRPQRACPQTGKERFTGSSF